MVMNFFLIDKNAHVHVHMGFFKLPLLLFFILPGNNVALLLFFFFPLMGSVVALFFFFPFDFLGSRCDILLFF